MALKTVKVSEETHERLTEAKPFDSLSYGEFINELLDHYDSADYPEEAAV